MTLLTAKEKEEGLKQLEDMVSVVTDEDVQYFRDKLINGLQKGQTALALEKIFKQLAIMEDAIVIYHEHRQADE